MGSAVRMEAVLREYGAVQHGLVTRVQLLGAGVADHVIERRVRSGRLVRVHRGVYQAGPVVGAHARELAAVLACGRDCRVSHRSAAVLWKFAGGSSHELVEVTMHRRRRRP